MNVSSEINWVGLGSMDSRMAPNLVKKGYDVTRFDIDRTRVSAAAAPGLTEAPTLWEAMFSMTPDHDAFLDIALVARDSALIRADIDRNTILVHQL